MGRSRTALRVCSKALRLQFHVPRGSYPTPFLGYLVLWFGSVILKSRCPKTGVGYEPLGIQLVCPVEGSLKTK